MQTAQAAEKERAQLSSAIAGSIQDDTFIRIALGNYKGPEPDLKSVSIRRAVIKKAPHLSFTYRYKTHDIVKNYSPDAGIMLLGTLVCTDGFRLLTLFTSGFDLVFEARSAGKWLLKRKKPAETVVPPTDHDRAKQRKIGAGGKPYLRALNITDGAGNVYKHAQDKFRQINHYIEILSALLAEIPGSRKIRVVDMGAGKGYLTFALYDYLNNVLGRPAEVTGVEVRPELVALCNEIAAASGFGDLHFAEGTIDGYDTAGVDVLIALHACDTATDDAIGKGIKSGADLIVAAPCCHKQIRREMARHKAKNELGFLTKHGIFMERQAEMVTDGIRAMILEYFGYDAKVFEFISEAHTPKNVLVVGQKRKQGGQDAEELARRIKSAKAYFGIEYHHLEKVTSLWPEQ